MVQVFISIGFMWEYLTLDNFQPFYTNNTALRIIASILLQQMVYGEMQGAIKMLAFLKREKLRKNNDKGRFINVIVCLMQLMTPIFSLICLMISVTQESKMGMITKDYVTLAFVLSIDNLFSGILPADIKSNVKLLNSTGVLKMGKDYNSMARIKKRLSTSWSNETWTL